MITIRDEIAADIPAREALLDRCLGERRTAKSSERLREGRLTAQTLRVDAQGLLSSGATDLTARLDFADAGDGPIPQLHYAFLISEAEFDEMEAVLRKLRERIGRAGRPAPLSLQQKEKS